MDPVHDESYIDIETNDPLIAGQVSYKIVWTATAKGLVKKVDFSSLIEPTETRPAQTSLIHVPAPPVAIAWRIEQRTKGEGDGDWRIIPFCQHITSWMYAAETKDKLERKLSGSEFRLTATEWGEVTEPTILL